MLLKDIKQKYQTNTHVYTLDVHIIYIIVLPSLHFTLVFIFDHTGWDVFLPDKISEKLQSIDWILNIIFYFVAAFQNRLMSKCNNLHKFAPYLTSSLIYGQIFAWKICEYLWFECVSLLIHGTFRLFFKMLRSDIFNIQTYILE
jgi:hypothetical protein